MSRHQPRVSRSVVFAKRPLPSPRRSHRPSLSLLALSAFSSHLIHAALAKSTHRGYASNNRLWFLFTKTYSLPSTPTAYSLTLYAAFLAHRGIKLVNKYFSALAYKYASRVKDWDAIRSHPDVTRAIRGAHRQNAATTRRSPPLLPAELEALVAHALSPSATYDDLLAATITIIGFGGLLRLGELVEPSHSEDRDPRKYIKRSDTRITAGDEQFHTLLPYHKADRLWQGSHIVIVANNSTPAFNFVKLIRLYLLSRDRVHSSSDLLLVRLDGSPPSRDWYIKHLRRFAPLAAGHSLRAGGATFLASIGVDPHLIKRMGRWSSDAWEIYIRSQPALAAEFHRLHLAARR